MGDDTNEGVEQLARELASARRSARRSLRDVAEAAQISAAYLQKLESSRIAKPSPKILRRLASALGVSYRRLMELAGYEPPSPRPSNPLAAHLAGASLTEAEERAVTAFIDLLVAQRNDHGGG